MKYILSLICLSIFSTGSALGDLFDNGVPPHSLGYADDLGYVLYTEKLFDLKLIETNAETYPSKIPLRLLFHTNNSLRKSFLLDTYWGVSIFDSYIAAADSNTLTWQRPDMNVSTLKWIAAEKSWTSIGGDIRISKNKDQSYLVKRMSQTCPDEIVYKNGFISSLKIARPPAITRFIVFKTSSSLILKNANGSTLLSIKKSPSPNRNFYN